MLFLLLHNDLGVQIIIKVYFTGKNYQLMNIIFVVQDAVSSISSCRWTEMGGSVSVKVASRCLVLCHCSIIVYHLDFQNTCIGHRSAYQRSCLQGSNVLQCHCCHYIKKGCVFSSTYLQCYSRVGTQLSAGLPM